MARLTSLLVAALVACGGSSNEPPDIDGGPPQVIVDAAPASSPDAAVGYDFSCAGQPAPTTAADPITVGGTTQTVSTNGTAMPVAGATVAICTTGCIQTTSSANGAFTSTPLASGGAPLAVHVEGTKAGYRPTYFYPAGPLTQSLSGAPLLMVTPALFSLGASLAGATPVAGDGVVAVVALDCNNQPVKGATIVVAQHGSPIGTPFTQGSSVITFNVPPGDTDVSATYMGVTFKTHTVPSFADAQTTTLVRPGT